MNIVYMKTEQKISLKAGPPIEGNDFYRRTSELEYAWKY